jgi:hypothetical protein
MRFEILMVVKISMSDFWVVTPCRLASRYQCFRGTYCFPEDGNSIFLQKTGIYLQVHTALQTRRPTSM